MTRWCPVCESPGRRVVRGSLSISDVRAVESGSAVRVRERFPGIDPSHFCTRCPTFFRGQDRFYLTSLQEGGVHGIAVWPHHECRLRIELGREGPVAMFEDGATVLIPKADLPTILNDYFWGRGQSEILTWARRRGFEVRLIPRGRHRVRMEFEPPGPHFPLLVIKFWLRDRFARSCEDTLCALEEIGAQPLLFPPPDLNA